MDLVSEAIPLHTKTRPKKGKGPKATILTRLAKSLVRPKMVHQHEWEVKYFENEKGKKKRKKVLEAQEEEAQQESMKTQ